MNSREEINFWVDRINNKAALEFLARRAYMIWYQVNHGKWNNNEDKEKAVK